MITSGRIYFQPAELNNIGDKVLHFEIKYIKKMYVRAFTRHGLEFILNDGKAFCSCSTINSPDKINNEC